MAVETAQKADQHTIAEIIAVIITLYSTTKIERGAEIGGTLLKQFGSAVFPHINKKELRFAKEIDRTVYAVSLEEVKKNLNAYISEFCAGSADNYRAAISSVFFHQTLFSLLFNSGGIVKLIKVFLRSKA